MLGFTEKTIPVNELVVAPLARWPKKLSCYRYKVIKVREYRVEETKWLDLTELQFCRKFSA